MNALARLHAGGFRVRIGPAGKLQAAPVSKLTPELLRLIADHAPSIRAELIAPLPAEKLTSNNEPHGTGRDSYGRPLPPPRPLVTCGACQHFDPNLVNPTAGAGICRADVGLLSIGPGLHPMAPRFCDHYLAAARVTGLEPTQ